MNKIDKVVKILINELDLKNELKLIYGCDIKDWDEILKILNVSSDEMKNEIRCTLQSYEYANNVMLVTNDLYIEDGDVTYTYEQITNEIIKELYK